MYLICMYVCLMSWGSTGGQKTEFYSCKFSEYEPIRHHCCRPRISRVTSEPVAFQLSKKPKQQHSNVRLQCNSTKVCVPLPWGQANNGLLLQHEWQLRSLLQKVALQRQPSRVQAS